jgi:hypothetical protein
LKSQPGTAAFLSTALLNPATIFRGRPAASREIDNKDKKCLEDDITLQLADTNNSTLDCDFGYASGYDIE